ncbi:hypothetical protein [Christiangramia forsetii]|uniref:Membrane or secreted protein n=2 Tax=Christiangramia forsetii TaxID=411153 RepID=A0LXT5_CHRFK|nr:hypothetical protein [Christiangramia forsetii]GGG35936.1 hypothetical protein GCM10011532_19580 [Christiangramia forsetii]CAL65180.1 membrane or secreted protein [Christiangramia forsetii KT0803]
MKKFLVLGILFALPITAYLFFASGKNNFAKLPVLTENVQDVSGFDTNSNDSITFKDHISVVAFFGSDLENIKGNTFNLDKKILEKYYDFDDFQFVLILPKNARQETTEYVESFKKITESSKWQITYAQPERILEVFESFKTPHHLDDNSYSPYVFIVDKESDLRGRDDEDEGKIYGYDSRDVAELNNKMNDDVKVILAEYRLALKKNNPETPN